MIKEPRKAIGRGFRCPCCGKITILVKKRRGKMCHACRMKLNPPRLGTGEGWHTNDEGYLVMWIEGKEVRQHRLVMEQHLGRKLTKLEVVHHIDNDKLNNNIDNLKLYATTAEHTRYHKLKKKPLTK